MKQPHYSQFDVLLTQRRKLQIECSNDSLQKNKRVLNHPHLPRAWRFGTSREKARPVAFDPTVRTFTSGKSQKIKTSDWTLKHINIRRRKSFFEFRRRCFGLAWIELNACSLALHHPLFQNRELIYGQPREISTWTLKGR